MVAITKGTINGCSKEKTQESVLQIEENEKKNSENSTPKRKRIDRRDFILVTAGVLFLLVIAGRQSRISFYQLRDPANVATTDSNEGRSNVRDEDRSDVTEELPHFLSDAFIDEINSKVSTWQAGRNFYESTPPEYIRGLVPGEVAPSRDDLMETLEAQKPEMTFDQPIPEHFDARTKWPHCRSLFEIRDQGSCGSCWAIAPVEVMTDRQCIHKNETFHYSTQDVMACCELCGFGCQGGSSFDAFSWWQDGGIVSGGRYGSDQGCMPYKVKPCEHYTKGNRTPCGETNYPFCNRGCVASYNKTYSEDLHYGKSVYTLNNETEILFELFTRGPVVSSFYAYEDFVHYKSGVYHYVAGAQVGVHVVKIIGYGVEGGVPYYLCANSWNYDWGNKGFFKIRRDQLSRSMVTGIPE